MSSVAECEGTFKVPKNPVPKSGGRKVLSEDAFISEMEKIIEADFFPDLKSLRLKTEYLEAMEANDYDGMRRAYVNLKLHREGRKRSSDSTARGHSSSSSSSRNFGDTPSSTASSRRSDYTEFDAEEVALGFGDDTPRSEGGDGAPRRDVGPDWPLSLILRKEEEEDLEKKRRKKGLDAFLAEHVSEDTESFRALMEKAEAERRRKKSWMFEPPLRPGETTKEQRLALPSVEEQADQTNRPNNIDSDVCPVYNAVMFVPEGQALTGKERLAMEKPVVRHGSTRLQVNPFRSALPGDKDAGVLYKRTGNKGEKIGVDGKLENEGEEGDGRGPGAAPRFDFISTPKIRPDDIESPLMTWGHVAGTPLLLEGPSRAGTPSFRMAPTPKRDQLAEKLAQRSKSRSVTPKVASQSRALSSFSDSPGGRRLSSMSPAAHSLMTRKLGITPRLRRGGGGGGLSSRSGSLTPRAGGRTPTPRRSVGVTFTAAAAAAAAPSGEKKDATPRRNPRPDSVEASLTDNLLKLPS